MTTLITPLPTPPTRQDSANFNDRADEFLGALPLFQQEANALAAEANINSQTAASISNVTKWVSGAFYQEGSSVWSSITGGAYRRITAGGSGTTDPSLDTTNYKAITGSQSVEYLPDGPGAVATTVQDRFGKITLATDYGTIQQAIAAAGPSGTLIIPESYAGTDNYSNTWEISVIDLRKKPNSPGNSVGGIGIYSVLETNGDNIFPMGQDLVLRAKGSADTYIEHLNIRCTTTANLVIGVNDVPISAVTVGNVTRGSVQTGDAYLFSEAGALMVGRETDNEEQINAPNFQILNGTTLRITCTKPHTGTTDIEMIGSTLMTGWDLYVGSGLTKPQQNTTWDAPLRLKDLGGRYIAKIPGNIDNAMPYGGWQWGCMQTGLFGADKHIYYQHALPTSKIIWRNSSGSDVASLDNNGRLAVSTGISGGIGSVKLEGTAGELQIGGRISSTITSPSDAVISWSNNTAPLNPSAVAGSLLIASSNFTNSEVVIASENTVNLRVGKNKIGFNGSTPVTKQTITGSRGGNAALANLLTKLASIGLITDSTTA